MRTFLCGIIIDNKHFLFIKSKKEIYPRIDGVESCLVYTCPHCMYGGL